MNKNWNNSDIDHSKNFLKKQWWEAKLCEKGKKIFYYTYYRIICLGEQVLWFEYVSRAHVLKT